MFKDAPLIILIVTVCSYWGTVALLAVYQRLRYGRSAGILPRKSYERRLWALIVPVVVFWVLLPFVAADSQSLWISVPAWALTSPSVYCLRWAAAMLAAACYLLSVYSWLVLGRSWSMAIVPGQNSEMVTGGLYRWVRHPIYSLQVGLMLASVVTVPAVLMILLACLHFLAMNLKARFEERFLEKSFGPPYREYSHNVGRFWPRWSTLRRRCA